MYHIHVFCNTLLEKLFLPIIAFPILRIVVVLFQFKYHTIIGFLYI